MDIQRFEELMKNRKFAEKIVKMQTPEEVQEAFKKEGVEISLEEIGVFGLLINKSLEKGGEPLSEEDLTEIAGGKESVVGRIAEHAAGVVIAAPVLCPLAIVQGIRHGSPKTVLAGLAYSVPLAVVATAGVAAGAGTIGGIAWALDKRKANKNKDSQNSDGK